MGHRCFKLENLDETQQVDAFRRIHFVPSIFAYSFQQARTGWSITDDKQQMRQSTEHFRNILKIHLFVNFTTFILLNYKKKKKIVSWNIKLSSLKLLRMHICVLIICKNFNRKFIFPIRFIDFNFSIFIFYKPESKHCNGGSWW
jgi:hypothetical protein